MHQPALAALLLLACCQPVLAAQPAPHYPAKPVRMIMPLPPGSSTDAEARVYQEEFQGLFKQPLVMDYKAGASGSIAYAALAKSPPDGYTLGWSPATIALVPVMRKNLPYDLFTDLAAISQTTQRPFSLAVRTDFPGATFDDFVAYAKTNPGKLTWGTVGQGGSQHMSGEWLAAALGIKLTFVHYKGGATQEVDLMAGRIDAAPKTLLSMLPMVKSGKLKMLALLTPRRSKLLPDMKTVAETGVPGYSYPGWAGIFAPAGVSPELQTQLADMFRQAISTPRALQLWATQGNEVVGSTPAEFRQMLAAEVERWRKLARDNDIRASDDNN